MELASCLVVSSSLICGGKTADLAPPATSLPSRLGRICKAIEMEPGPNLPCTARGAGAALGITLVDRGLVDKVAQLEQHLKLC